MTRYVRATLLQTLTLVWLAATPYPFFWLVMLSVKTPAQAFAMPPVWVFTPTFDNYGALVTENFTGGFVNSVVVAVGTVALSLVLGVPASYAFARVRFRGHQAVLWWVLIVRMVPGMAYVVPYFVVYRQLGMLDTPQALVILYTVFNLSLVIWTMQAFFGELPRELEESARIDGASVVQTLLQVVLPLATPGLIATAILCFLFSWNEFLFALVITRSDAMTAPVAITRFLAYEGAEWGKIAAGTVVLILPVLIFAIAMRRYLVRGLLAGAVKG